MCEYCGRAECTLTKQQVLKHGPIIEENAYCVMRVAAEEMPQTYAFKGESAYNSLSALIPDESEENPHAYMRYYYDEDENYGVGWVSREVMNPLKWKTEKEFLKKVGID